MKILHVLTDHNIGGAGRHFLTYLKEHDRIRFQPEVVLPVGSRLVPEVHGVNIHEVRHIRDKSFSVKGLIGLVNLFRSVKPDIVHTHASLSGRIAARLLGISVVSTRHYCIHVSPLKTRFPIRLMSGIFNSLLTDKIIAVSDEVKKGLLVTGTEPSRIEVVYNGVEPIPQLSAQEKQETKAKYGVGENAFVVLQAARLSKEKGHVFTLEAAKTLMKTDPEVTFLLAGDGPLEDALRKQIADEGINNVVMAGFVHDIGEVMGIADLQLNASLTEATCISLLEGMSLGLPAVAAAVDGNPYVIFHGENGLLVPPESPQDIAESILQIKRDSELKNTLAEGSLRVFEDRFRSDVMVEGIERVYTSLKL